MSEDARSGGPVSQRDKPIVQVFVGAWREALSERGFKRALLLLIVASITIAGGWAVPLFWAFEKAGIWGIDSGWSLP